jgi:hypothetical protein
MATAAGIMTISRDSEDLLFTVHRFEKLMEIEPHDSFVKIDTVCYPHRLFEKIILMNKRQINEVLDNKALCTEAQ